VYLQVPSGDWGYLGAMEVTLVPEPGSFLLLMAGMIAWFAVRRRS
jgi:hypothetical protein